MVIAVLRLAASLAVCRVFGATVVVAPFVLHVHHPIRSVLAAEEGLLSAGNTIVLRSTMFGAQNKRLDVHVCVNLVRIFPLPFPARPVGAK